MKVDKSKLVAPKERPGRPIKQHSTLDALKESGVAMANYSVQAGDTITFPADESELSIIEQPVRANSTAKAFIVGVNRNGTESYLSLASLRNRDRDQKTFGDVSTKLNSAEFSDDSDRLKFLFGQTIKCTHAVKANVPKFVDGFPTAESVERNFYVCEFAND